MIQDRSGQVLAIGIAFLVATWPAVGLRTYIRARMLKSMGWDDYTMLLCQIVFTAYLTCQIGGALNGTGKHIQDLTQHSAETALKASHSICSSYKPQPV